MSTLISITEYKYKQKKKKINLKIKKNTFISIIGAKMSGKRYLSKYLVEILEKQNKVYLIPDCSNYIFLGDTVKENLKLFCLEKTDDKIKKVLNLLFSDDLLNKKINDLTNSEKQLVIISEAILSGSEVFIIENSLVNLDPYIKDKVLNLLKKIVKLQGVTIINFTQSTEECLFGDEVVIINNGEIVIQEKKNEVFKNEKIFKDNNLKLPFMVDLSNKLMHYGLIDKIYLSKTKLVNELWK